MLGVTDSQDAPPDPVCSGLTYFCGFKRPVQNGGMGSSTGTSYQKGLAISPAPCYCVLQSESPQRAPAAAAMPDVPTFTLICFGFASSRFGMLSVSTPF